MGRRRTWWRTTVALASDEGFSSVEVSSRDCGVLMNFAARPAGAIGTHSEIGLSEQLRARLGFVTYGITSQRA